MYVPSTEKHFPILLTQDKDFQGIYDKLKSSDTCFASVPISNSDESKKLRTAHAQRVISSHLQRIIWQPFSSEKPLQQEDITSFLKTIAKELVNSSQPGSGIRAARVWSALTTRALQSMSPTSQASSSRAQKFVEDVTNVLSPLITPSQEAVFQKDLLALAESAISMWNSAQTGELEVEVCSDLVRGTRDEWRSPIFDPPEENTISSSTHNRVFVLFPRVMARRLCASTETASPPGSWPESEEEPHTEEICIHPGLGVAEWSALVLRGKEEVDDEQRILEQLQESAKRAAKEQIAKKRMGNDKRLSITESVSSLLSPVS